MKAERLSLDIADLSTPAGLAFAVDLVTAYHKRGIKVHLFAAVPCTPWTSWQHYNLAHGTETFRRNLMKRRAISLQIIDKWKVLAELVHDFRGENYFEWPRGSSGWPHVLEFFDKV